MRGERRGMAETHRTRPWGRFGHWRRFGAAQRSEGYPPSMTLRRSSALASDLADVRV